MALIDDIRALSVDITNQQDTAVIAAALSQGRIKTVPTEIGNGMVLATIGLTSGNALLDVLNNAPDFRHVRPLLEQGRLDISTPLARAALDGLVGVVITQAEADALKALAERPDPIDEMTVRQVCWSDDGVWQV